jgi:hypothetical protein
MPFQILSVQKVSSPKDHKAGAQYSCRVKLERDSPRHHPGRSILRSDYDLSVAIQIRRRQKVRRKFYEAENAK